VFSEDRGYWYPAIQIAAGILMAAAVMTILGMLFAAHQLRQAERAIAEVAAETRARTEEAQARQRAEAAVKAERERQQRLEQAERTRRAQEAQREGIAQMEAKERAWNRYYQTPPECEKPANWDAQVECGNRHIRARREFEINWERGELR
jgi:uncharacterized membrane protein YhiD involved in acid resistance